MRVSKLTRRNGCAVPAAGVTTERPSYASGPDIQRSVDGVEGSVATYTTPPMVSATDAVGSVGVSVPAGAAAAVIGNEPDAGTLAVTRANLIEPSAQRLLMSVCVASVPTFSAEGAIPRGTACPDVAQPVVNPTVAIGVVCADSADAPSARTARAARGTPTHFFCILDLSQKQQRKNPANADGPDATFVEGRHYRHKRRRRARFPPALRRALFACRSHFRDDGLFRAQRDGRVDPQRAEGRAGHGGECRGEAERGCARQRRRIARRESVNQTRA